MKQEPIFPPAEYQAISEAVAKAMQACQRSLLTEDDAERVVVIAFAQALGLVEMLAAELSGRADDYRAGLAQPRPVPQFQGLRSERLASVVLLTEMITASVRLDALAAKPPKGIV